VAARKIRQHLTGALRMGAGDRRHRAPRPQVRDLAGTKIIADGLQRAPWRDVYHNAMTANWPTFFGALAAAFVAINLAFAFVYVIGENPIANARPGSLADYFFFSVETTSTVGYGDMHPQTFYGHIVATSENFIGMVMFAVMTGLTFARFSRPQARLVFSKNPVIAEHDGAPTLSVRLANARQAFITEATAKMWVLRPTHSQEGRRFVGFQPLRLVKSENPALALSWTLFHPIDPASPLYGLNLEELVASEANFIVSISGFDETAAQIVRTRHTFAARDLRLDHEFVDMLFFDGEGVRHVDYGKIDATQPVQIRAASPT
jgi:inward rectifier potassium channel